MVLIEDALASYTADFLLMWDRLAEGMPEPELEYKFHPNRKYRFDCAWPGKRVAVEVDGGQHAFKGGRHCRDEDRWKLNEAAVLGWRVLRFSHDMIRTNPVTCVRQVVKALGYDPDDIEALRPTEAEQWLKEQQKPKKKARRRVFNSSLPSPRAGSRSR